MFNQTADEQGWDMGASTGSHRLWGLRGRSGTRTPRRRIVIAAVVASIGLASCSALSAPADGGDAAGPISSKAVDEADETGGAEVEADAHSPESDAAENVWERADDAIFLPDSPRSDFQDLIAPRDPDGDWTVIGSIFDYTEATDVPTVWTTGDPTGKDWAATTIENPGDSTESKLNHAEWFGSTLVAVGQQGSATGLRPAVWLHDGTTWTATDPDQFDGGREAWLFRVAAGTPEQGLFALGVYRDDARRELVELWHSDDGTTWEALDGPFSTDGTDHQTSIAVTDAGVSVVGYEEVGSEFVATTWFSPDGRTWEQTTVPDLGSDWTVMNSVTSIGDRLVAVGGAFDDGVQRPVSWTSDDGIEWSAGGGTFTLDENSRRISGGYGSSEVDVAGGRFVSTATESFIQHIWTSSDGLTWQPLTGLLDFRSDGFSVAGLGGTDGEITVATRAPSVVHHGDGWADAAPTSLVMPAPSDSPFISDLIATDQGFTAVGGNDTVAPDGSPLRTARAWTSSDGLTWTRVTELRRAERGPISAGVFDGTDVVSVGREATLGGGSSPADGLVWRSAGAIRWQPVSDLAFSDQQSRIGFDAIATAGDTLIIGGFNFDVASDQAVEPIIVESSDGETFERSFTSFAGPGDQFVRHVCGADDGRAVAIHHLDDGNDNDIGVSVRNANGGWAPAISTDGSFTATSSQSIDGCAHGVDGFVAAGWVFNGTDSDIGLWASPDGTNWSAMDGPGIENNASEQWLATVAPTEDGYALIGRDGSDGSVGVTVWVGRGDDWAAAPLPAEADGMNRISMTVNDGVIVVAGNKDGARRVYRSTLEAIRAIHGG